MFFNKKRYRNILKFALYTKTTFPFKISAFTIVNLHQVLKIQL